VSIEPSPVPRYRYYEAAPESIPVPISDLLVRLPAKFRTRLSGDCDDEPTGQTVSLPCQQLFLGNTPRLSLGTLHELLPKFVALPQGADLEQLVPLPAGWLALYFDFITKREELPPEPVLEPEPPAATDVPKDAREAVSAVAVTAPAALSPEPVILTGEKPKEHLPVEIPTVKENEGQEIPSPILSVAEAELADAPSASGVVGERKRGFLSSLPIFRRHAAHGKTVPKTEAEAKAASETSEARPQELPLDVAADVSTRELPPVPPAYQPRKQPEPETSLTLERLWKLDPQDQIADPSALQNLFMTEEKLTLERVIALAGQFPGLRSCVLATGDQVICTSAIPAGIDLRTLSRQAVTMLSHLRDSSAQMGLGAVPAITLHAEQGILSFLYQGELCLLVLHADRGFVPGVRERLQEMLVHLTAVKSLPESPSAQPGLVI
jgi:predicted regulator of Ras-like GTPase activity (Roadblock/LC7/MglB family)